MNLGNVLRSAFRGISGNKLRSALTTLGIIIGVASVIDTLALGNGARAAVEANFRFLGSDGIRIVSRQRPKDGQLVPVGKILSYQDGLEMPAQLSLVNRVEMSVDGAAKARHGRSVLDMSVTGTTADALANVISASQLQPVGWKDGKALHPLDFIGRGRFFTPEEVLASAPVCVLGYQTALDLFQGDESLDQTIWVNRQRCQVIGVLSELEPQDPSLRNRTRPNDALYLPISTAIGNLYANEPSINMVVHVNGERRMAEAKRQVATYLRQRHNVQKDNNGDFVDDFDMTTRNDILGAQQDAARTFALLLATMAAVSLGVGGIGIMNVMLVSVTERTREIGVRMAVGARGRDVVAQFLSEALLLSAGGGILGVATGVLAVPLAAEMNKGIALLAPESIPLAFSVAPLVGVVFGLYPAIRASRLDPIEALRYE